MVRVVFTPHLKRHLNCPDCEVEGSSIREVLESVFLQNPRLRGYVLDDQNCLRKHVTVFLNGAAVQDRIQLTDSVTHDDEVYVMQALSGG